MEAKTFGNFLAALRKAQGMTQKELAERLHISDKTVSRWERDEGTPDLAIIPVLAEIFGVSCDELLRGERRSPADRVDAATTAKGERERRRLLQAGLSRYRSQSMIAVGLDMAGLIAALICNLAFLQAVLGFFIGALFLVAGAVCQAIFMNQAFSSVADSDLPEEALQSYRQSVIGLAFWSFGLTLVLLGFNAPLLLVDAYLGLSAGSALLLGIVGGAIGLVIYGVARYFVKAALVRRGVLSLGAREDIYWKRHRFQGKCALVLAALLLTTAVVHWAANQFFGPYQTMVGTTFTDFASFAAYMEEDVPGYGSEANQQAAPEDTSIAPEEISPSTLEDENGNVLVSYQRRNYSVFRISYGGENYLPITVYTYSDLAAAKQRVALRNLCFVVAYVLETSSVAAAYLLRRKQVAA